MSLYEEDKSYNASMLDLLDRFSPLHDSQAWPRKHEVQLHLNIILSHAPDAGAMPLVFVYLISKDLWIDDFGNRVDRGPRYIAKDILLEYNKTWLNIIHSFLAVYTNCS